MENTFLFIMIGLLILFFLYPFWEEHFGNKSRYNIATADADFYEKQWKEAEASVSKLLNRTKKLLIYNASCKATLDAEQRYSSSLEDELLLANTKLQGPLYRKMQKAYRAQLKRSYIMRYKPESKRQKIAAINSRMYGDKGPYLQLGKAYYKANLRRIEYLRTGQLKQPV